MVIKAERRVLKELGFCVHVKHPHKIIVFYLKILEHQRNERLVQTAWNYMNDSLRTNVFMRYSPETIAAASIYLAARQLEIALPKKPLWFAIFGKHEKDLQDICITIRRLYARKRPNYQALEKVVTEAKRVQLELKFKLKGFGAPSGDGTPVQQGFSPGSRTASPRDGSPLGKKSKHGKLDAIREMQNGSNHVDRKRHSKSPKSNEEESSRSPRSVSPSPRKKHRGKTPPKMYSDKPRSRSHEKHRSRKHKHRSHSRSLSPPRHKRKKHRHSISPMRDKYRARSRSYERSRKKKSHHRHSPDSKHRR